MKLPNLRLYETQATVAMVVGALSLVCAAMLALFVFQNLKLEEMSIDYSPAGLRRPVVFAATAVTGLAGLTAGILGFNSLGQRRNTKQPRSWLGMLCGALAVASALVLFFAWLQLSQPLIKELGQ